MSKSFKGFGVTVSWDRRGGGNFFDATRSAYPEPERETDTGSSLVPDNSSVVNPPFFFEGEAYLLSGTKAVETRWESIPEEELAFLFFGDLSLFGEFVGINSLFVSAFRQIEIPILLRTNGKFISWEQTRGPTVVFDPPMGKSITIIRPDVNDDPYKIRANIQGFLRDGSSVEISKELLIYTTPSSSVDSVVSNCQVIGVLATTVFSFWFLPLSGATAVKLLRKGDTAKISWSVSGGTDLDYLTGFEWQTLVDGVWVSAPLIKKQQERVYWVPVEETVRIICYFNNSGLVYSRVTPSQTISPTLLVQDSPTPQWGSEEIGSFRELLYTNSGIGDGTAIVSGSEIAEWTLTSVEYRARWDGSNAFISSNSSDILLDYRCLDIGIVGI